MTDSRLVEVMLNIPAREYLEYYSGTAKNVVARAVDGRVIHFPASILQSFVTHRGIHGKFIIEFDENNKFVTIRQV